MSSSSNNPGVGLRMTSRRNTFQEQNSTYCMSSPGPQSYDVQFKLTEREKRQNELMSHRYDNWKKDRNNTSAMNIVIGGGSTSDGGIHTRMDVELNITKKVLNDTNHHHIPVEISNNNKKKYSNKERGKNSWKRKGDFSSSPNSNQ